MAARVGLTSALAGVLLAGRLGASAIAEECARAEFEAVVTEAAEALKGLNQANKPGFQAKLRQLKAKRSWTHDQFLAEAAPIVQDAAIARFDDQSAELLSRIERMGSEGASGANADCARLAEVRASMKGLVDVQKAKWAYMFEKIEAELRK
jgi:hypothetical protein